MAVPHRHPRSHDAEGDTDVPVRRLLGDFVAFELKLLVDGFKDVTLGWLALLSLVVELLFLRGRRGRLFYGLMKLGARFERWLGLYEPHSRGTLAEDDDSVSAELGHVNHILRDAERRIFKTTADDS